jgi:hypothetical protein
MGYAERKAIIEKIEAIRGTKVVTYITSTRPNIRSAIDGADLRYFFDHLMDSSIKDKKIDLFIYSNGGDTTMGWSLPNLIREFTKDFSVIVPFRAFSCATQIALGANEIVMSKMGSLGPIDPTVANEFNPIINGQRVGISVEDVNGYAALIKEKFELKKPEDRVKLLQKLPDDVKPLALGNVYRIYQKSRDDARKLLHLHMDAVKDKKRIENIVEVLVEKLYFHGHHINRVEAKKIGLDIVNDEVESAELPKLIWDLYLEYEKDMSLLSPYKDEAPASGTEVKLPFKFIESTVKSSVNNIVQNWIDLGFPPGTRVVVNNGQVLVVPPPPAQALPLVVSGQIVQLNGKIYDKQEVLLWQ